MFSISIMDGKINVEFNEKEKNIRKKGSSLLEFPCDYTVIDLETTGTDPRFDDIIEIACIKFRDNKEVGFFQSLVQPDSGPNIPSFITELTGITNEMLSTAPNFKEIADKIWEFINGEIIVGHNVNFDINFLYDWFWQNKGLELSNDYVDTLRLSRWILTDMPHHRLVDLCEYYSIDAIHHRSVDDCKSTQEVFQKLKIDAETNNITFTKHKNGSQLDLREIRGDENLFKIDHPFYKKNCVFTGCLEKFTRKDAAQIVCNIGGICENGVTKKTNFLIVGDFDYSANIKDGKSSKLKKAEELILNGQELQIISENTFYNMLEDSISNT